MNFIENFKEVKGIKLFVAAIIGIYDKIKIQIKNIILGEVINDLQVFNKYEFEDSFFK